MNELIKPCRAYVRLGMLDEALESAEAAMRDASCKEEAAAWVVRVACLRGDFKRAVSLGTEWLDRGVSPDQLREYTAVALHRLGQSCDAAGLLCEVPEAERTLMAVYHLACFLAAKGDCDLALRSLHRSLAPYRNDRAKTWLDGDLKPLWPRLAEGRFNTPSAHLLVDREFDFLREWQPSKATVWELDPANWRDLPDDLRRAMRFEPELESYVLDHAKAPPGSTIAAQFDEWAREEVRVNQGHFDKARGIAWQKVLDAQPHYARSAGRRGDLSAVRHHVLWTIASAPQRLAAFSDIPEIRPLIEEMRAMLESDPAFFDKIAEAYKSCGTEPAEGLELLNTLPEQWQGNELVEHIRGVCLEARGQPRKGLACLLRACERAPQDATFFITALTLALRYGWKEIAAAIHRAAPAVARCYRGWLDADARLKGETPEAYPVTMFCGQPDLGGKIVTTGEGEIRRAPSAARTATP